jgi:hypothetical protein
MMLDPYSGLPMVYDGIYDLLPENPVVSIEMRNKILDYLKQSPDVFSNVNTISEATGIKDSDKTMPTIRKACKELLHFDREPVISSHAGFCFATKNYLVEKFRENMLLRIKGMERTVLEVDSLLRTKSFDDEGAVYSVFCSAREGKEHYLVGNTCIWCGAKKR